MKPAKLTKFLIFASIALWVATDNVGAQLAMPVQASTTGSGAVDFEFRTNGTLIATSLQSVTGSWNAGLAAGTGSLLSTDQGAGSRMLWFPAYSAFRAGMIDTGATGAEWNQSNIGLVSAAFGLDTTGSGLGSFATGLETLASGAFSASFNSTSVASGSFASAFNSSTASGVWSSSFGFSTNASGTDSLAVGSYDASVGWASTTVGHQNTAGGSTSLVGGFNNWTNGDYSTVFGMSNGDNSYASFVVGRCAVGGGYPTAWIATDPLFEVGNGSGSGTTPTSDAIVVYKNGNMNVQGVLSGHSTIRCAAGGDLSMGSFTSGTPP